MEKLIIHYQPHLKKLASKLRRHSTTGEKMLWNVLKTKQIINFDFHRQKPIGNYIVDFYCPDLRLIIEIDGSSHEYKTQPDKTRQQILEKIGLRILRFTESDVKLHLDGVVQAIKNWTIDQGADTPLSRHRRGSPL